MDGKTKNRDLGITAELGRGAVILFVRYVKPKAVPACGESGCECNEQTKGERLKAAKCRELFPPQSAYADSSPARGGAFWCSANSYVKPALKGEVDMSVSEWTEGLHRGFACLRQPLSQSALRRIASSP